MSQKFIVDLSNYKDRFGAKVEPDRYLVVVEDAELDKSKAGNTMVNTWLRIVDGPFEGSTLTDRLTMTEKSLFRVVGFMQAIGLPTPKKRLQIDLRQFVGKHLLVDVDDGDPYNGTVRSEVRGYVRFVKKDDDSADLEDDLEDEDVEEIEDEVEEVSDDPTDYDEDEEPEKVKAATRKRRRPVRDTGPSEVAPEQVEAYEEEDDATDPEEIDLDSIDLG